VTYIILDPGSEKLPVNTVYCIGKNYADHAKEMGSTAPEVPIVFIKPATAVVDGNQPIDLPDMNSSIHYEGELVILLDAVPRNIDENRVVSCILGFGVGLDLTARDLQKNAKDKGLPWALSKGFDGSAPVSHFIRSENTGLSPSTELKLTLNGTVKQHAPINTMIFPVHKLILYLSRFFSLRRGDLLFTGTPMGVGPIKTGDTIKLELGDIISITTTVQNA
jgi:2-keto-4-pentenoate hydratase/2-oxohepta-3-ene-1,7-dioic acid hydratase in catechol pathway